MRLLSTIGIRKTTACTILTAVLIAVLVTACAWNLDDRDQLGRLEISFGNNQGVGTLDISSFNELSLFVVEAQYFAAGGRTIHLSPQGDFVFEEQGARSLLLTETEGTSLEGVFQLSTVGPEQQTVPRGSVLTFVGDIPTGSIVFDDLVVGKEYVVWVDGLYEESQLRLGFGAVRIRSGADSVVSINMADDRFLAFADFLYTRYVQPFLPPPPEIGLGDFDGFVYAGTGSAWVTVQGEQPRQVDLDRGWVLRFFVEDEFGQSSYNVFALGFYSEEVDDAEIVVVILEDGTVLEPSRASYQLQIADETMFFPEPGTIFEVDLYLDEREYYLLAEPAPSLLGAAGFSGGSPGGGGTFSFGVTGAFEEFEFEPTNIEISGLTFTYGELLETFDDEFGFGGDFEYAVGDTGPAGGYIFFVDSFDQYDFTYLEAAPIGWWFGFEEDFGSEWSASTPPFSIEGTQRDIGAGELNTQLVLGSGDTSVNAFLDVEFYANDPERTDFDDWFLPSLDELILMYQNLHTQGIGGFAEAGYWSSWDQFQDVNAPGYNFATGNVITAPKDQPLRIRPVRSF
ncbi:MAG: DUF1566 domain-containing protein [Spirochaetaceae bacterium]|nr:MAG: DUF1566 domain-containing protein [Spirochaetaceae bacterium]